MPGSKASKAKKRLFELRVGATSYAKGEGVVDIGASSAKFKRSLKKAFGPLKIKKSLEGQTLRYGRFQTQSGRIKGLTGFGQRARLLRNIRMTEVVEGQPRRRSNVSMSRGAAKLYKETRPATVRAKRITREKFASLKRKKKELLKSQIKHKKIVHKEYTKAKTQLVKMAKGRGIIPGVIGIPIQVKHTYKAARAVSKVKAPTAIKAAGFAEKVLGVPILSKRTRMHYDPRT